MSKKKTRQPEFFRNLDLAEQVRQAMPIARQLLRDGIESDPTPGYDDLVVTVMKLARNKALKRLDEHGSEREQVALSAGFAAAKAIGIAIGLLLRPETFNLAGGAR